MARLAVAAWLSLANKVKVLTQLSNSPCGPLCPLIVSVTGMVDMMRGGGYRHASYLIFNRREGGVIKEIC